MSTTFDKKELTEINAADDLKIAPFRADGIKYGTPTWIWAVVVDGELYVRAYNGKNGRWYQSAIQQKAGRIYAAGYTKEVTFEPVTDENLNTKIDEAYKAKYSNSSYLAPMISQKTKNATVKISLKD
ncbi:MAG: DUF2255 domain-containing protein [Pseudopedobacter saltans]|uniref:DUF2255 domain-containing protein n=1 Tax=Pseudopedobacter saltans TaxID=151895 RepID=A0A2W5F726_9SPHI|nr:MAG: DUF2255 domain-containing protein [Pseudopedobacter saltans]